MEMNTEDKKHAMFSGVKSKDIKDTPKKRLMKKSGGQNDVAAMLSGARER